MIESLNGHVNFNNSTVLSVIYTHLEHIHNNYLLREVQLLLLFF